MLGELRLTSALVIEHAQRLLQNVRVDIVRNAEQVRANTIFGVEHVVLARARDFAEVEAPGSVARARVGRAAIPRGRRAPLHLLAGGDVDQGVAAAGRERFTGVETGLRIANDRKLLRVGQITELVDDDERGHRGQPARSGSPGGGGRAAPRAGAASAGCAALFVAAAAAARGTPVASSTCGSPAASDGKD